MPRPHCSPGQGPLYDTPTSTSRPYHRDQSVFAAGVTIEDDMAVLVRYRSGTTLTYHLTAYSPWEGYRVMFNTVAVVVSNSR